ncbi:hypothetical protein NP233_g1619 [Leucocoprinus birnbaumii]|uniref:Uncharacterized protein n=1 Tax=Leucocoprinus birnbaumii TaxID=56174 RepID=A0AAD5W1U0_9AGAR|nr:hypothetical protein NP233_g1619 [Leucocoprinus birnbaumii]
MSGTKYADLPDIDTAPDIYETDDVFPTTQFTKAESSDEEGPQNRHAGKKQIPPPTKEELDMSGLMDLEAATKKFMKAERRNRSRSTYVYPPSPDSSPTDQSGAPRPIPLSQRLRLLNTELTALEIELSDPSNPLLQKEREEDNVDPGELIKDLVVVRGRLDKLRKGHEGRARLIGTVLEKERKEPETEEEEESESEDENSNDPEASKMRNLIDIDKRVGELEKIIGSSSAALDETSPLPPPLLPLITRLNSQLALLTQPRHIDSISRRLKLLLSDLDRASVAQQHRRYPSQQTSLITPIPENLLPILSRLGPALPQIPHILTRLRTLSALHTSAADFQATLEDLEKEHRKVHDALNELDDAIKTVEKSLEENRGVVKKNVADLEGRVESLLQHLEELGREQPQER